MDQNTSPLLALEQAAGEQLDATNVSRLLEQLDKYVQALTAVCERAEADGDETAWRHAYYLVFSSLGSHRVSAILRALNLPMSYYDPDMDHKDDALAYVHALQDHVKRIRPLVEGIALAD